MNTILAIVIISLCLWIFIERRKNRHFKKQFRKGTYWIQYYPFCSYDLANKIYKLNSCEVVQQISMAEEVNADIESTEYKAVTSDTFHGAFYKMVLKRSDDKVTGSELAGYEIIYTAELISQAQSLGVSIVAIDEIV
jgi:hypothetical protein